MTTHLTINQLLVLVACIIFGVGFGVFVFGDPGTKFFPEDVMLGLAFFAAGHALP